MSYLKENVLGVGYVLSYLMKKAQENMQSKIYLVEKKIEQIG